jgi:FkbM family methyltransferase
VLDIGANIGIYAGLASTLSDREVYAFEPMPQLADEARNFASDNGLAFWTDSVALGAENGEATFYLSDSTDSSNSLAEGFRQSSKQIQVKVQTVDDYVAQTGIRPAIMKIDTETTEPDVLAGATETIAKCRPWILCEVLAGRVETRLTEVLAPFGYHWYHINGQVPHAETNEIVGDPTHEHLMWLFTPERPGEEFWSIVRDMATAVADCTPSRSRRRTLPERWPRRFRMTPRRRNRHKT